MERRTSGPPGFVVEEIVLGEAAGIHDAEMRVDAGPIVAGRLAAVVKAGPGEPAGEPGPRRKELIPGFRGMGPGRGVVIVSADVPALFVIGIDSTGANGASLFGADIWLGGMRRVVIVHVLAD